MKALTTISRTLSKLTGRTGLQISKHAPEILLGVGIVGVIGTVVLACKATLKADDVLEQHRDDMDRVAEAWDKAQQGKIDDYTEADHQKDMVTVYAQTAMNLVMLYGPAVALGAISIACLISGNRVAYRRSMALVAAYKAIEESYSAYRKRVVEEYGEGKDYLFKNGFVEQEVIETVVDEDGKTKKVKTMKIAEKASGDFSMYARCFDESCSEWSQTPEYNFMFLRAQQNYCNDLLKARGHLFLNEVYEMLGFPHSKAGSICGWVVGKDRDNFVDFGIFDGDNPMARAFVNGYERSIWLDFNVDGVIYDLI